MKKETAKEIIDVLCECSKAIEESVKMVKTTCSERTFIEYRRVAGRVLAYIFTELLGPLYDEHPELAPEWYNARTPEPARDEGMPSGIKKELVKLMDDVEKRLRDTSSLLRQDGNAHVAEGYQKRLNEIVGLVQSAKQFLGN